VVGTKLTVRLTHRVDVRTLPAAALTAWATATLASALVALMVWLTPEGGALAHSLLGTGPRVVPHATSNRTVGYALRLLLNNAIVALWPLTGLYILRDVDSWWRRAFMVVVVLSALRSIAPVAAALGLWGTRLLPYIPNAPFELAAITTSPVLYALWSGRRISVRELSVGITVIGALLVTAAALETWAVPLR
jgi:hypothetical protein